METITIIADGKKEKYQELLPQLEALIRDEGDASPTWQISALR